MTEAERLERERNWVAARFNCTVDSVFQELVAVIKSDIASFNRLSNQDDCTTNVVEANRKVTFSYANRVSSISTDGITISAGLRYGRSCLSDFTITPKWNEVEMRCDLIVDGKKMSMHLVSQKVIGEMLFGYR